MSKRLTLEQIADIEQRTQDRLTHQRDDGWELEDLMRLLDHIAALEQVVRELTGDFMAGLGLDGAHNVVCGYCHAHSRSIVDIVHDPTCPIVRGRALVAQVGKEATT